MNTRYGASRRHALRVSAVAAAAAATIAVTVGVPAAAQAERGSGTSLPTVVLVHGAFADSSGWADVTTKLQRKGYTVLAASSPLRGLQSDADYLKAVLSTIEGPLVLVGHSYGGAVITNAATGNPNVKSLVYIAGYALDEGESAIAANELGGGHSEIGEHLFLRPYPGAPEGDADAYIDPAHFGELFAADLPAKQTAVLATAQRPVAASALFTPSGEPAWKTIPSWYLVAAHDRVIPPEAELAMAERAGSTTVEVDSSHAAMISQPSAVVDLILDAAK
ncbi:MULTISPECIES: alpha/beta fold hydrolase [unclassified Agromyces]|uniref:alpha/beta fold hydrolase n=1 Tax=unclassified Agromyces TaxID=2639701 RepID=UPI003015066C